MQWYCKLEDKKDPQIINPLNGTIVESIITRIWISAAAMVMPCPWLREDYYFGGDGSASIFGFIELNATEVEGATPRLQIRDESEGTQNATNSYA